MHYSTATTPPSRERTAIFHNFYRLSLPNLEDMLVFDDRVVAALNLELDPVNRFVLALAVRALLPNAETLPELRELIAVGPLRALDKPPAPEW